MTGSIGLLTSIALTILIALVVAVLAVAAVVLLLRRRGERDADAGRPRTVADLVRLRAEAAAAPAISAAPEVAAPEGTPAGPAAADPAAGDPAESAPPHRTSDTFVGTYATDVPLVAGGDTPGRALAAVGPAAVSASVEIEPVQDRAEPVPAVAEDDLDPPAESPTAVPPRDPAGTEGDTPWARAARMTGDESVGTPPAETAGRIPDRTDPPAPAMPLVDDVAGEPAPAGTPDDDWSSWADWAEVDADEDNDHRATAHVELHLQAPPAPELARQADELGGAVAEDPAREAAEDPEPVRALETGSDSERIPDLEPVQTLGAVPVERAPAPEPVPDPERAPDPAPSRSTRPLPALSLLPPLATAAVATEPAPPRARRSSAEAAAEQAAADLALLRTFGFADPSLRTDSAPIVSLVAADPGTAPVDGTGPAQQVRVRALARDGSGVAGAGVALLDDRGRESSTALTNEQGRAELRAPRPGAYVVVSTAPDHQPGAVAITVSDEAVDAEVPLARSAAVVGSVLGEDGPIDGARLTLVQDGEIVEAVDSAADGRYRIADLAAGDYGLSVAAAGWAPIGVLLQVPDGADLAHDVELDPAAVEHHADLIGRR